MPEQTSDDLAAQLFDRFVQAGTFHACMSSFQQICDHLGLNPKEQKNFYTLFKTKVATWKAKSLWAKLDKRYSKKDYKKGKACTNTRVLIIGAGPVGLRTAIECAMLGTKCIVIEKRDSFSRNNVLHLWPFLITDLKNLGAKKFFGKFCAGAIDHISIRQLQLILLKVALLFGVEIHTNVAFEELQEPPEDQDQERVGWRAKLNPKDHPLCEYEFDVVIGADGKRNTLPGFKRKEFRGKLAIAITANFINRHSTEEARVEEISGVAFIFNQKFFQDLKQASGIDLENIVYYRDDTHYFVMTAKKKSLIQKGVILEDRADTIQLLSRDNYSLEKLQAYAREAADFSTNKQLPSLDFALNHYGQPDVAMFDFTSIFQAEHAARILERKGHRLLMALVGDSLLEPFWPTGSGCARGFLGALDTAWMIRNWSSNQLSPPEIIAERESIYRLLAQTTPENLNKVYEQYGVAPSTRYPHINLKAAQPHEVLHLYDTDDEDLKRKWEKVVQIQRQTLIRSGSIVRSSKLLMWCQRVTDTYKSVHIDDMTSAWRTGLALCAIIHRYRPHLIDFNSLREEDTVRNNQLAFDLAEREFGISPTMTGKEMAEMESPDKLTMVAYISRFYDLFKDELPPPLKVNLSTIEEAPHMAKSPVTKASFLSRISNKIRHKKSHHGNKENEEGLKSPVTAKRAKTRESPEMALKNLRAANIEARLKERIIDRANERAADKAYNQAELPTGTNRVSGLAEQLTAQFRTIAGLTVTDDNRPVNRPKLKAFEPVKTQHSDTCFFCGKRVYVMERLSVEGLFFHRDCFRCQHCETTLHIGNYAFARDMEGKVKGKFYCRIHYPSAISNNMPPANRKRSFVQEPATPTPSVITTIAEEKAEPATPPVADTTLLSEPTQKRYRATPERIELESMRACIAAGNVEVTEEEIAKYNLGTTLQTSGEEDDYESSDSEMESSEARSASMKDVAGEEGVQEDASEEEEESDDEEEDSDDSDEEYSSEFESDSNDEDDDEDSDEEDSDEDSEEEEEEMEVVKEEQPRYNHINKVVSLKQQWLNNMKAPEIPPWRPPEEILAEKLKAEEEARKVEEARQAEEERKRKEEEVRQAEEEARRLQEEAQETKRVAVLEKRNSKLKFNLDALSQQYTDFEVEAGTPIIPKDNLEGRSFQLLTDDEKVATILNLDPEDGSSGGEISSEEDDSYKDAEDDPEDDYMSSEEVFEMDLEEPPSDAPTGVTSDLAVAVEHQESEDKAAEVATESVAPETEELKESQQCLAHEVASKTLPERTSDSVISGEKDLKGEGDVFDKVEDGFRDRRGRTVSGVSDSSFTISTPSGSFSSISVCSVTTDSLRSRVDSNPMDMVDSSRIISEEEVMELDLTVKSAEVDLGKSDPAVDDGIDLTLNPEEMGPDADLDIEEIWGSDLALGAGEVVTTEVDAAVDDIDLDLSVTSGYHGNDFKLGPPLEMDPASSEVEVFMEKNTKADDVKTLQWENVEPAELVELRTPKSVSMPEVKPPPESPETGEAVKSPSAKAKEKPKYRPMYSRRDSGPRSVMSRSFSDSFTEMPVLDSMRVEDAEEGPTPDQNANTTNGVVYRNKKIRTRPDSPTEYVTPPTALRPTSIKMDTLSMSQKRERTYSGGTARDKVGKKKEGGSPKKSPKRQLPKIPSKENCQGPVTPENKQMAKKLLRQKTAGKESLGLSSSASSLLDVTTPGSTTGGKLLPGDTSIACMVQSPLITTTSGSSDQFFTPDNAMSSEYLSVSQGEKSPLSDHSPSQFTDGIPQSESRSEERKSRISKLKGDFRRRDAMRKTQSPKAERKSTSKKNKKKKSNKAKSVSSLDEPVDRSAKYRVTESAGAPLASKEDEMSLSAEGELDTPEASIRSGSVLGDLPKLKSAAAELPRLIRKLSVDPNLSASLDLDSSTSSDDEDKETADEGGAAASPGSKGKGKAKSPRRMWGKRFKERRKVEEEELNDKLTRRVQREARRQHHQQQLKRHRMAQEIQRHLHEVEVKQRELENRGVYVEKALRGEGGDDAERKLSTASGGVDESTLMQQWFNLVNEKNALVRYESELMVQARELELEDRHCQLEQELRQRMAIDDGKKTEKDREVERLLLEEMLEVVEQRDALVALLEEERLKERKEDLDIEEIMLTKGLLTARGDAPIHV